MARRLIVLGTALFLVTGCAELESDKFQTHRDALQRGESPLEAQGLGKAGKSRTAAKKRPAKPRDEEEDVDLDEEAEKDRVLSALDKLAEQDR